MLVFFTSYELIEKAMKLWDAEGLTDQMKQSKALFFESKNNQGKFHETIQAYYKAIDDPREGKNGAIFFCVFKGSLSEGFSFEDRRARLAIIVGVPYPCIAEPKILFKRYHLDQKKKLKKKITGKELISGDEWYRHSAHNDVN